MNITVIGLGLIGGSIALELKSQLNVKVTGVDESSYNKERALSLGLVHKVNDMQNAIKGSDLVIVAIPVDKIEIILPMILDDIESRTTVVDVGSTKVGICKVVANHPNRQRYVAAHPLAGTEFSGPDAAVKGLFQDKKNIICEKEKAAPDALRLALKLFESLGLINIYMHPTEHDRHMAYVSHLSHVSSFMLGQTVLDIEKDEKQIFDLAGTGFASTVRLAKSNPQTWLPIFRKNNHFIIEALDSYIEHLEKFRQHLYEDNYSEMENQMTTANEIKRILN